MRFKFGSAAAAGVLVARGQSVEGFGGKEPYYPILEALAQLARGPATVAGRGRPDDQCADLAESVAVARAAGPPGDAAARVSRGHARAHGARAVRSARGDQREGAAAADSRRSALGRSLDARHHLRYRPPPRAGEAAGAGNAPACRRDPRRKPAQSVEAGSGGSPLEPRDRPRAPAGVRCRRLCGGRVRARRSSARPRRRHPPAFGRQSALHDGDARSPGATRRARARSAGDGR